MLQPITASGHVYDVSGNPVSNQTVTLDKGPSGFQTTTTTSDGAYSLQFLAGTYDLGITGGNSNTSIKLPQNYHLEVSYSFTQSITNLNLTLPAKQVAVHVQNASGDPVSNVGISTNKGSVSNLSIATGLPAAVGYSEYRDTYFKTNASGDVILWLFPSSSYTFTAVPPSGSIYTQFILNNILVTGDQTEIISLQYTHDTPLTNISLSPDPKADGTYQNPVTVTLSATAASGFTVAHTYYKIDTGDELEYTAPFVVSGSGDYTITYWSIDNSGVKETPKNKPFTIHSNQAPVIDPISDKTINEGDEYSATGLFKDEDSLTWTGTVNYGDSTGDQPLTFNPDKTFSLSHI